MEYIYKLFQYLNLTSPSKEIKQFKKPTGYKNINTSATK
jgi:hypothetical protein